MVQWKGALLAVFSIGMLQPVAAADDSKRVLVTLASPVADRHVEAVSALGGELDHVYTTVLQGFSASLPEASVAELPEALGADFLRLEDDMEGGASLDRSTRQVRARQVVWPSGIGFGLLGDPSVVIAICDTGIDPSHPDLAGRVVEWQDFSPERLPSATDEQGHGTAVAGTAAGTGVNFGIGIGERLTTTFFGNFPDSAGLGFIDMVDVSGPGGIGVDLDWAFAGTARANVAAPVPGWATPEDSSTPPLVTGWPGFGFAVHKAFAGNEGGLGGRPFSMQVSFGYFPPSLDGVPAFQGMAPLCSLAGIKILDRDGRGRASDWIAAFDWIAANAREKGIRVANASVNLDDGAINLTLRDAGEAVVEAGVVLVVTAGNAHPDFTISDPGLTRKAISVGAINDWGEVTSYSSRAPDFFPKPDVVAPGGSHSWDGDVGSEITCPDSNVADGELPDRLADDYVNVHGTSFSAPHVAGLAALLASAMPDWSWSETDALRVKELILATATETNLPREEGVGDDPGLHRGARDYVEGHGKINADAAVEALLTNIRTPPGGLRTDLQFGPRPEERKAWATRLDVVAPGRTAMLLEVDEGVDLDLHLYRLEGLDVGDPTGSGSTNPEQGADESLAIVHPNVDPLEYVLVVKWISGTGTATLRVGPDGDSDYVPDCVDTPGEVDATSLRLSGLNPGLRFAWDGSQLPGDAERYTLSRGSLAAPFEDHAPVAGACELRLPTWDDDGAPGSFYYLVAAGCSVVSGSLGSDSLGTPRVVPPSACP